VYSGRWTRGSLSRTQQFEMAVGAILTQNTAWTNAERALDNLRRAKALSVRGLLRSSPKSLERWLRPSGYFRQKTRRLRSFARHLHDNHGGRLDGPLARPLEAARVELLSLHGIGPETADSILLYAGGRALFVVDAYTRRVAHRLRLFGYNDYAMIQAFFHAALPRRVPLYRETHALLVAHAKAHCRAVPRCAGCPLLSRCVTGRSSR